MTRDTALRLKAAIAAALADGTDALWPDEIRTLEAAARVADRLASH